MLWAEVRVARQGLEFDGSDWGLEGGGVALGGGEGGPAKIIVRWVGLGVRG